MNEAVEETLDAGEPLEHPVVETKPVEEPQYKKLDTYVLKLNPTKGAMAPPNLIFIGTGSPEKKYRQWVERRFQAYFNPSSSAIAKAGKLENGMTSLIEAMPLKETQFIRALCWCAVVIDETNPEGLLWGNTKHPRLDTRPVIEAFVRENMDILLMQAPYFGIKAVAVNPSVKFKS